jgi:lipopolysaccharide/colanic/teichoic acid biosynthesis glycosyltransferase
VLKIKRNLHFILTLSLSFVATPVLLILILAQAILMGRPIFFRQQRTGLDGRPFVLIKFRTMHLGHQEDHLRLTKWGRLLRSTSLDELPELWNVLKGDMHLIGPRPLPCHYMARYSQQQAMRHTIKPGMTGWAQVNGRNCIRWERQFELDLWYIQNRSPLIDGIILLKTILLVIQRKNINESEFISRGEFMGNAGSKGPKQPDGDKSQDSGNE